MNVKYAVTTHFDSHSGMVYERGLDPSRVARTVARPEWWKRRAEIMRDYVFPSLLGQRFKDFDYWALFQDEHVANDEKWSWSEGCCATPVIRAVKEFQRQHGAGNFCTNMDHRGAASIREYYADDCDRLVLIFLDSDDMYSEDAFAKIAAVRPDPGLVMFFGRGYIYGSRDGRLGLHDAPFNTPPFYATVYTREALQSEAAWNAYRAKWNLSLFHHDLRKARCNVEIEGREYLYHVHGDNTTTAWENPYTANKITGWIENPDEKARVLRRFGVSE